MTDDQKLNWIFDSLIEFLKGPIWNIPIFTFIEQKSIIFEPGCGEGEIFMKTHNEYRNLVDFMLESYMEDMGISPEDFENACGSVGRPVLTQFQMTLFEQVWAADEYEIFKHMMIQKNMELQLQALELMISRYSLSDTETVEQKYVPSIEEEKLMKEILSKTMEEYKPEDGVLVGSREHAVQATMAEKVRLETEKEKAKVFLQSALSSSIKEAVGKTFEVNDPVACEKNNACEKKEKKINMEPNSSSSENFHTFNKKYINPIDMEKRQIYLREQRDRLLASKRKERAKDLAKYQKTSQNRPKSAEVVHRILKQEPHDLLTDPTSEMCRKSLSNYLKKDSLIYEKGLHS